MGAADLREIYGRIRAEMTGLAGGLEEIPRRAALLYGLYLDSGGNHAFPLIAAHGALWAFGFFEVGGSLGRFIARRYFFPGCHRMEPYRSRFPSARASLPHTEALADRLMALPTGTNVSEAAVASICAVIRVALANGRGIPRPERWRGTEQAAIALLLLGAAGPAGVALRLALARLLRGLLLHLGVFLDRLGDLAPRAPRGDARDLG